MNNYPLATKSYKLHISSWIQCHLLHTLNYRKRLNNQGFIEERELDKCRIWFWMHFRSQPPLQKHSKLRIFLDYEQYLQPDRHANLSSISRIVRFERLPIEDKWVVWILGLAINCILGLSNQRKGLVLDHNYSFDDFEPNHGSFNILQVAFETLRVPYNPFDKFRWTLENLKHKKFK